MAKRNLIPIIIIVFSLITSESKAQSYQHQLGVRMGSYDQALSTGFTYRYFFKEDKGIEAIIDLNKPASFGVLYEEFKPLQVTDGLKWFYGAGGFASIKGHELLGITGILGLDYQFAGDLPLNVSVDWKPELNLIDYVGFRGSTVGVSLRLGFAGTKK